MWPFDDKKRKEQQAHFIKRIAPTLEPMDIVVCQNDSLLSRQIRRATMQWASHVFVIADDTSKGYSIDWRPQEVALDPYLLGKSFRIYRMERLTQDKREYGIKKAQEYIAKNALYPVRDLVSMAWQNFWRPGESKLKWDDERFICSQFVAWLYSQMGFELAPNLEKHISMYTPGDCIVDNRLYRVSRYDF